MYEVDFGIPFLKYYSSLHDWMGGGGVRRGQFLHHITSNDIPSFSWHIGRQWTFTAGFSQLNGSTVALFKQVL